MRQLAYLMATLLMSACASDPVLETGGKVTEVPVPVAVRCVEPADVPELPPSSMPAHGDVGQNAAGVIADAKQYRMIAERQQVLLQNCTTVPAKPAAPK